MDCQELVELVTDYLEGALDETTRTSFEEHLEQCPGCAAHLDQLARTIAHLGTLPVATLTQDARETLLAAFRDLRR